MALKIFISSGFRELKEERRALEEEIRKLQDLFVGMEYFGSDPSKPAEYCIQKVEESDLYVGVFGDDYGSVDKQSQKSFTELEYDAARHKDIPCLIYFKRVEHAVEHRKANETNLKLDILKTKLLENHIVYTFSNLNELELQFLVDFIKVLRGPLFDKAGPYQQQHISIEALHSLSKGLVKEQIKTIGQHKYIHGIYIEREAEKEIDAFIQFEETFLNRATAILEALTTISQAYRLEKAALSPILNAKSAIKNIQSLEQLSMIVNELKHAFYYNETEEAFQMIFSILREQDDAQLIAGMKKLSLHLNRLPFITPKDFSELPNVLFELRRETVAKGKALSLDATSFQEALSILPSRKIDNEAGQTGQRIQLANELIKELNRLIQLQAQRSIALVAKAGYGKTNVICRLAERLVEWHPVILLSGQMEISSEYDIEFHVQRRLESEFRGIFSDWMNRVSPGLKAAHKWLFILIDGINENSNLPPLIRLLKTFLPKLENKRIKLILSCRDTFWDLFSPHLTPYLFQDKATLQNEFTEDEWQRAVQLYFNQFNIQCMLDESAKLALRNPLLLRFFCEVYRGQQLGKVSNLRLLSVFDLYLERISKNIAERFGFLTPDSVVGFLIKIGREMWTARTIDANLANLGVTPEESSKSTSVYNLVRSENIILEEIQHRYAIQKSVRFLYDEFMEYMIARCWADQLLTFKASTEAIERLLQEVVASINSFSPAFGAILFLDKMLARNGALVNRAIALIASAEDAFVASRQITMLYAFENIDVTTVNDELIIALYQFEATARAEIKERLAPVILRVFRQRPDHLIMKDLVGKILEIDHAEKIALNITQKELKDILDKSRTTKKLRKQKSSKDKLETLLLPPGRYHYTEETKLNAIGILAGSKNTKDYEFLERGIRNLGRMDLHSALHALASLDLAADELVYSMISKYLNTRLTEYRIYCAWLLRERYGKEPAKYIIQLLVDDNTRIHRYTFDLFKQRLIESELVDCILNEISKSDKNKPWHLVYMAKLLGKKAQFRSNDITNLYGKRIVTALKNLCNHPQATLRLEAYRALIDYDEFIDVQALARALKQDQDVYVQSLAGDLIA